MTQPVSDNLTDERVEAPSGVSTRYPYRSPAKKAHGIPHRGSWAEPEAKCRRFRAHLADTYQTGIPRWGHRLLDEGRVQKSSRRDGTRRLASLGYAVAGARGVPLSGAGELPLRVGLGRVVQMVLNCDATLKASQGRRPQATILPWRVGIVGLILSKLRRRYVAGSTER